MSPTGCNGNYEEIGVCCHCHPHPQCGHYCEVTTCFECNHGQNPGHWLGPQQDNDCEFCEEVCENCDDGCTYDSDCPEGQSCVGGQCEPDVDPIMGCNTPGQPNCEQVVHVKRPRFPDGTPVVSGWGVAVWRPPCDSDCDGDLCDEGVPCDKDGDLIVDTEDRGVVTFDLWMDTYDEDGNPIGEYLSFCCCSLYLIVQHCFGYVVSISLDKMCIGDLPEWNPQDGDILLFRGKVGTPAEGWCGHTLSNFGPDGSQSYGPCGRPVHEWVVNNFSMIGSDRICHMGCFGCCAECVGPATVALCDLDIEVFNIHGRYDWLIGAASRLCHYICDQCAGVYKQCGQCPDVDGGMCLNHIPCDAEDTYQNMSSVSSNDCYHPHIHNDCRSRIDIITNEEHALNDFYWNMPHCGAITAKCEDEEQENGCNHCGEDGCQFIMYTLCGCASPGLCPETVFISAYTEWIPGQGQPWWEIPGTIVQAVVEIDQDVHPYNEHYGACYTSQGLIRGTDIPSSACREGRNCLDVLPSGSDENSRRVSFFRGGVPIPGSCHCSWNSPSHPNQINCFPTNCRTWGDGVGGAWDSVWDCHDCPVGFPGCTAQACDEDQSGFIEGDERIKIPMYDNRLFPSSLSTEIEVEFDVIKSVVPVTFKHPNKTVPTPSQLETVESLTLFSNMMIEEYSPNFVKEPISSRVEIGSSASNFVPQVNDAHFLGSYLRGNEEWSAFLHIDNCLASTYMEKEVRIFNFTYTVFGYCNSGCKGLVSEPYVIEKKSVAFDIPMTKTEK